MNFPHNVVHNVSFPTPFPEKLHEEAMRMVHEINIHKEQIIRVNRERRLLLSEKVGFVVVTKKCHGRVHCVGQSTIPGVVDRVHQCKHDCSNNCQL